MTQDKRLLLLGGGELGYECAVEALHLGIEVIVVDRYAGAPAMTLATRSYQRDMLDYSQLRDILLLERPTWVMPEIEAVDITVLREFENKGVGILPSLRALELCLNREVMRDWASCRLHLPTSNYQIVEDLSACHDAVRALGMPCVFKPMLSSSGKGQSVVECVEDIEPALVRAQTLGYRHSKRVMLESWVAFDYEITLLTVRHRRGIYFFEPIGHSQINGNYNESWQPHVLLTPVLSRAQDMARAVVDDLGGYGVFGVEFFVRGDDVIFNEVAPRPHDTGLVTLISQNYSQFSLHLRAAMGLPMPDVTHYGPSASAALNVNGYGHSPAFRGVSQALAEPDTDLKLYAKPEVMGVRRLGVALARAGSVHAARAKARKVAQQVHVDLRPFDYV